MFLADIASLVLLETGYVINPAVLWKDEWEHPSSFPNPAFIENVRREGVALSTTPALKAELAKRYAGQADCRLRRRNAHKNAGDRTGRHGKILL